MPVTLFLFNVERHDHEHRKVHGRGGKRSKIESSPTTGLTEVEIVEGGGVRRELASKHGNIRARKSEKKTDRERPCLRT